MRTNLRAVAAGSCAVLSGHASGQILQNGDFQLNLNAWTIVNTVNGLGAPGSLVHVDIDGPGALTGTNAARFCVGREVAAAGGDCGVEMTQVVNLTAGVEYTIDFDWSAQRTSASFNSNGGEFSAIVNGAIIAGGGGGSVSAAVPRFGHVTGTYTATATGPAVVGVRITRPFVPIADISQYVDNISICATGACTGACCVAAGVCTAATRFACLYQGGVFRGEGTVCPPAPACSTQYFCDDGMGEFHVGLPGTFLSMAWLNRFTVANGLGVIESIDIAFGVRGGASLNGVPVTVYMWSDPNGDGSPADAQVLAHSTGVVANSGTQVLNRFPITPVDVGPNGTQFFVGAVLSTTTTVPQLGIHPGTLDSTYFQGRSWVRREVDTVIDPGALGPQVVPIESAGLSQVGNWLVRANATAGTSCYANCDASTQTPALNVGDFTCFLQKYAAGCS